MLEVRHHGLVFPRMWPLNQLLCFQSALGGTSSPWSCPPAPPPAPRVPVGSGASMPGFADTLTTQWKAPTRVGTLLTKPRKQGSYCNIVRGIYPAGRKHPQGRGITFRCATIEQGVVRPHGVPDFRRSTWHGRLFSDLSGVPSGCVPCRMYMSAW